MPLAPSAAPGPGRSRRRTAGLDGPSLAGLSRLHQPAPGPRAPSLAGLARPAPSAAPLTGRLPGTRRRAPAQRRQQQQDQGAQEQRDRDQRRRRLHLPATATSARGAEHGAAATRTLRPRRGHCEPMDRERPAHAQFPHSLGRGLSSPGVVLTPARRGYCGVSPSSGQSGPCRRRAALQPVPSGHAPWRQRAGAWCAARVLWGRRLETGVGCQLRRRLLCDPGRVCPASAPAGKGVVWFLAAVPCALPWPSGTAPSPGGWFH